MKHDRNDRNNTKFIVFPFCSFGLNFSYVTQYFLRILRNNVFLSLMRKFCKIFLNLEPRKTVHLRPNQLDLSNLRFSRKIKIHITVSVKYDGTFFSLNFQAAPALLKFIYCKNSTVDLSYVVTVKSRVEISQNCVAFSEYMNFSRPAS